MPGAAEILGSLGAGAVGAGLAWRDLQAASARCEQVGASGQVFKTWRLGGVCFGRACGLAAA